MKQIYLSCILGLCTFSPTTLPAEPDSGDSADSIGELAAIATKDFELCGQGTADAWSQTEWIQLSRRNELGDPFKTRAKILYSASGVYFLFDCQDSIITSSIEEDFGDLFHEDVVEVFIWPDENSTIYFEYELSPKNHELALLVPNFNGEFHGWRPWRYQGERKTRHKTGKQIRVTESGERLEGWTAEFFIPYALLKPLQNVPPKPTSHWRINLYRADFDSGKRAIWSWQPFEGRFHDYKQFGYVRFK